MCLRGLTSDGRTLWLLISTNSIGQSIAFPQNDLSHVLQNALNVHLEYFSTLCKFMIITIHFITMFTCFVRIVSGHVELVIVGLTLLGLPLGLVPHSLILGRGETHGPHHFLAFEEFYFYWMVAMIGGS